MSVNILMTTRTQGEVRYSTSWENGIRKLVSLVLDEINHQAHAPTHYSDIDHDRNTEMEALVTQIGAEYSEWEYHEDAAIELNDTLHIQVGLGYWVLVEERGSTFVTLAEGNPKDLDKLFHALVEWRRVFNQSFGR